MPYSSDQCTKKVIFGLVWYHPSRAKINWLIRSVAILNAHSDLRRREICSAGRESRRRQINAP